jgi:hypothetical protein
LQANAKDNIPNERGTYKAEMYKIKLQLKGLLLHLKDLIADLSAFTYIRGQVEKENYTHKLAIVMDSITRLSAR